MADNQAQPQASGPHPGLKPLHKLVGTWKISGMAEGETTFEWMDGGFFLIQRGMIKREGRTFTVLEIIGYEQSIGAAEPASGITSRAFTSNGVSQVYTYEADEETLTMWMGPKGASNVFKGKWSDEYNTLSGAWEWPGGGYHAAMTRI